MTVSELIDKNIFTLLNDGGNHDTALKGCYCCDLLSIAMGHAPEGCIWVTVMNNVNTLAVASLAECGCVVLACDVVADDAFLAKAKEQNITVFKTDLPVFDAALKAHECL
ncbi:MAG: hypothetical protein J6Y57_08565 [Lachnospiraceae bacterium]|nr:hypothetical protein [Lachnospiraceae bacterium]